MKIDRVSSLVMSLLMFFSFFVYAADEHVTPTAPADFLAMENPVDEDDIDEAFLKSAGEIYKRKCKKCHGSDGDGEGSAAEDIEIKPTNFIAEGYMDGKKDGQLYWIIVNGSDGTEMEAFGPGSDVNLSEEEIWSLISFMRSKFTE